MSAPFVNPVSSDTKIPRVLLSNELVTGPIGQEMLHRAGDIFASPSPVILDNAAGAGIITALLQQQAASQGVSDKLNITAADKAPAMINTIKTRIQESGWTNVEVQQFDHVDMPLPDESFDHVFTNFGIFFSPDDRAVLKQIYRVLKPEGIAGFTSWKDIAWWPMVQEALRKNLPEAPPLQHEQSLFSLGWNDVSYARSRLEEAGFRDVRVEEFKFKPMVKPDDFGEATAVLVKFASVKMWEKDARKTFGPGIQDAITKHLKETYHDGIWDGHRTRYPTGEICAAVGHN